MASLRRQRGGMRLLLVSNRLPMSVTINNNRVTYAQSVGGVAIGLGAISRHYPTLWIGALNLPGEEMDRHLGSIKEHLAHDHNCLSLVLSSEEMDGFYNGLSNSVLWPLFHGMASPASFPETWWTCYVRVNKKFSEAILKIVKDDDVLWINDYHLLLLPQMLRSALPEHKIGFFLHIPFPEPSVLDRLPFRDDLLKGLSGSNQVGVYINKYKQRLTASLDAHSRRRNTDPHVVESKRGPPRIGIFPLGIDPPTITALLDNPGVQRLATDLRARFTGRKVLLSADRLDYTKGILQKLRAYEILLQTYPEFRQQIQLILIVAPCRMGIEAYSQLNHDISSLVHDINSRHRTVSWEPIHFLNRAVPYEEVLAYYKVADVAVITSLEDAMNVMAKEFLYAKGDEGGALVLSRKAGAAIELTDAYLVDPLKENEVVEAMREALLAHPFEIARRNAPMRSAICRKTAVKGAKDFLDSMDALDARTT
jgi:trehalose 6-phosphate synthase/phosphatase